MTTPSSASTFSRGTELALQKNPDVEGWDIELVIEDTQGTPEQGAAVANKLSADGQIVGVVGHTFSGSTEVAIPIYDDAGIVMVSTPPLPIPRWLRSALASLTVSASQTRCRRSLRPKYIYEELGINKLATMHDGGAYGKGLADLTAEMFESLGGTVVGSEAITPGETDYSAPLAAIDSLDPGLIYYGGYAADAAVLVDQMPAAGLDGVMLLRL
ncbi:MAG: branched-chain amino acid ABC transporter substrate-binding protein [Bacteroidales bacterium]|nr:branched-chain amino acid ABC transporter substrate-binding protein [Bacteroidales bacterium]